MSEIKDLKDKDGRIILTKEEIEGMPWSEYLMPLPKVNQKQVDEMLEKVGKKGKLKIVAKDYSMATRSYDIFFSGCAAEPKCKGCHNPESWDFNMGTDWYKHILQINGDIKKFGSVIDKFFILGGEPLDQDREEFLKCIDALREYGKEMWLFTRYELDEVPCEVQERFDYIKCGRYMPEHTAENHVMFGVKLATANQRIYKKCSDYLLCDIVDKNK